MSDVNPVPEGYSTVTPSLTLENCAEAIEFYQKAFGAEELSRAPGPGGSVWHAELQIGDSKIMVNSAFPEQGAHGPGHFGGSPMSIWLYVEDADAAVERAVEAGADIAMPLQDMFWGDRMAKVTDPFGFSWTIATHVEDVSPEEMQKRQKEAMEQWGD